MRFNHPAAAAAFRAVAAVFSEGVRIEPMVAGELSLSPDDGRAIVTGRATVTLSPSVDDFEGARQGTKISTAQRIAGRDARAWFTTADYAALGYLLRPGDRVVLVERDGAPAYSVSRPPIPTDRGDVSIHLVEDRA